MDKAGNVDTGTLDHFTNYKYAPTRSTPLSVFVLSNTGGGGGAASQTPTLSMANGNGGNHGQRQVINGGGGGLAFNGKGGIGGGPVYSLANGGSNGHHFTPTDSEMTSMTSLSNSALSSTRTITTPPNQTTANTLPMAEE